MSGTSEKNKMTAALLCFFLGCLGIHSFYAGKKLFGVLQLLTGGGLGVWALIDFIMILTNNYKDGSGALIAA